MAKNNSKETFSEIERKGKRLEALINLSNNIWEMEKRAPVPFNDFLFQAATQPTVVFRNIFQLFYDMIHHYIPEGYDHFERDGDHIGFVDYNTTKLFVEGCDEPFFADRLFANRLMNMAKNFRKGTQNNRIYIFEGPPGSGKSTFLNNLLFKLEEYARIPEGASYKTYWKLDVEKLGGFSQAERFIKTVEKDFRGADSDFTGLNNVSYPEKFLEFSCPNHDHPILQIPKNYRKKFLDELISDEDFKEKLFNSKEYEWVLKDIPCSICNSIYKALIERLNNPLDVFMMINARRNYYNRQLGEGISVFNPGDEMMSRPIVKPDLQFMVNDLTKNDEVRFVFSYLAKTNNGILALMDIKEHNIERLKAFHGIISDGIHKVELTEEQISSIFLGLVNPEDKIHYEKIQSFQDRIISVKISYVLDPNIEVAIYKTKFGERITTLFLPRVLENFAKIIIASRLDKDPAPLKRWISKPDAYTKYLDKNMMLLKMDVYSGKLPTWLSEEDIKKFNKNIRKDIIAISENEGIAGISGRKSLSVFSSFLSKYAQDNRLITMDDVKKFFSENKEFEAMIPADFLEKLEDLYDYHVLGEVKESIYYYNERNISRDIQNYLYCVNFEIGETVRNEYTGDLIEITEDYLANFEARILGAQSTTEKRRSLRRDVMNEYVTETLAQEIRLEGKKITNTKLYQSLFEKYTRIIKENALAPYAGNDNFRRAILDFGTPQFNTYDERLKRDVSLLISNLIIKFKYSEVGAKQVAIYVLDNNLVSKY